MLLYFIHGYKSVPVVSMTIMKQCSSSELSAVTHINTLIIPGGNGSRDRAVLGLALCLCMDVCE